METAVKRGRPVIKRVHLAAEGDLKHPTGPTDRACAPEGKLLVEHSSAKHPRKCPMVRIIRGAAISVSEPVRAAC